MSGVRFCGFVVLLLVGFFWLPSNSTSSKSDPEEAHVLLSDIEHLMKGKHKTIHKLRIPKYGPISRQRRQSFPQERPLLLRRYDAPRQRRHAEGYTPPAVTAIGFGAGPPPLPKLAVKDNHKPIFKDCLNYRPVVKEEQPINTFVFTIKAEDNDPPDMGGTVTYKFVSSPGEKERFHVDPETGRISTKDIFDHDEPSREKEAYITVRASDNGHPQLDDACTIKIIIEDINDNQPVFDKVSYSESVPQDLQAGRVAMRISATDIDDGNNSVVEYSLDSNSPDQAYFDIDRDNGVIFLNKTIDKPIGYTFKLSVIVNDKGHPPQQSSMQLDITVVDSNKKRPTFTDVPVEPIYLKESFSDFINPIATIRAESNIPEEKQLQFELVQGQTEQTNKRHTFILEPEGNEAFIKLGGHLDYEKIAEYILTVRVQNNYKLADEKQIIIRIEDVNDNIPIFSEIHTGKVSENEPPGTFVMQVRAFDYDGTDANKNITYELADASYPFAIDRYTGNVTTLKTFDREEHSFYNIKVIATDNSESALTPGKHNSGSQVFLIEIADKNDNSPKFTAKVFVAESIPENANVNELVTQVTALDDDTASIVRYYIVDGNTNNAFSIGILTGEIRVNNKLDYETQPEYSLSIKADDGQHHDYATALIKLQNLNDNPPKFLANYSRTIEEERLYDGCIVRVAAIDPDLPQSGPQNIAYSLVKSEQQEFLSIDNDGCLRLTKPLDRDPPTGFARWQIIIAAADHFGKNTDSLKSTTEVILDLTDINDNPPFLTNSQPVVWDENQAPGEVVALTARDYDSPENGPPFAFALNASTEELLTKFSIVGNKLIALVKFDREAKKKYHVPVAITDSGTPENSGTSILDVVIGDDNDNPMRPGNSTAFAYNYKGQSPDMEIARVYVNDPDDWDLPSKTFALTDAVPVTEQFEVAENTGMILMRSGTSSGEYLLKFNVSEENLPLIPLHYVEARVNVTVKEISEEAVDKSGSIRFLNCTPEDFIIAEDDGSSKMDKLHRRLATIFNASYQNVDVFSVMPKVTVTDVFLDVRYSVHGSPYYSPEKLNAIVADQAHQDAIEKDLNLKIFMVGINECLRENEQCEDSCVNVLMKSSKPAAVYTNTTSFIGVSAWVESRCVCEIEEPQVCLNGGTAVGEKCECHPGFTGPKCELTTIGFHGDGWAMYPPPPSCAISHLSLTITTPATSGLIFYVGPTYYNPRLPVEDFMSLELKNGYPFLLVNYGTGTTRQNNTAIYVSDNKPHLIEIFTTKTTIEMFVDRCKLTTCMSLGAPTGTDALVNDDIITERPDVAPVTPPLVIENKKKIAGPLVVGGAHVDLRSISTMYNWKYTPSITPFTGCVANFTYNKMVYNLGEPAYHKNADSSCSPVMSRAISFSIDHNFLVAILVCTVILVVLLLAVVVHRRRSDTWAEKELDDIRENIIAYEDEGGGEGDAGYDLHVLRQMYEGRPPDADRGYMHTGLVAAAPDISGFLDDKKSVLDRDADVNPLDDVRHYAYEGDGNSTGSLSSLASSGIDDGDQNFTYLNTFGPRFRKLADMYNDSDDDRPHEESWC